MGTIQSIQNKPNCLICWENIDDQPWCKCVRCNIIMHDICEETYRGQKGYCQCPYCRRYGSIGKKKLS